MEKLQTDLVRITWYSDSGRPFCAAGSVSRRARLSMKREHRSWQCEDEKRSQEPVWVAWKFRQTGLVQPS